MIAIAALNITVAANKSSCALGGCLPLSIIRRRSGVFGSVLGPELLEYEPDEVGLCSENWLWITDSRSPFGLPKDQCSTPVSVSNFWNSRWKYEVTSSELDEAVGLFPGILSQSLYII